jgi:hypothetical protein
MRLAAAAGLSGITNMLRDISRVGIEPLPRVAAKS